MLDDFLSTVNPYFGVVPKVLYLVATYLIGIYFFWSKSQGVFAKEDKDNRRLKVNSVFDLIIVCSLVSLLFSRLLFILGNPDDFVGRRWFWLPYEKIEDQVYIMESFPWKFFKLTDGGFQLDGFLTGLVGTMYIFSKLLNLNWKKLLSGVVYFFWSIFVGLSGFLAFANKNSFHLIIFLILLGVTAVHLSMEVLFKGKLTKKAGNIMNLLWKILVIVGVQISLIICVLSQESLQNSELFLVINISGAVLGAWIIIEDLLLSNLYKHDWRKDLSVSEDNTGAVAGPVLRQKREALSSIGRSKVGKGSLRIFEGREKVKFRNFSRSYKDFKGGWKDSVKSFVSKIRKRKDQGDEESV